MQQHAAVIEEENNESFSLQLEHNEIAPYPINISNYTTIPNESQRRGVAFMIEREVRHCHCQLGGFICDSLGSGKTLQCYATIIERLLWMRRTTGNSQKTLVIAPATVVYEWLNQAQKHLQPGVLRVLAYHGSDRECPPVDSYDVLLTTYGIVQREWSENARQTVQGHMSRWHAPPRKNGDYQESPFTRLFDRIIVDEAHNIRNRQTRTHKSVCSLDAEIHWAISATMIYNNIDDLYGPLRFIEAEPYCVWEVFVADIMKGITSPSLSTRQHTMMRLRRFLLPLEIRRPKSLALPALQDVQMVVDLVDDERMFYDTLLQYSRDTVKRLFEVHRWLGSTGWGRAHSNLMMRAQRCILASILRLRQACVNPQMVIDAFNKSNWNSMPQPDLLQQTRLFADATVRLRELLNRREEGTEDECGICYDAYASHAIIPCGHTLCENCCATLVALNADRANCPFCKRQISGHKDVREAIQDTADADSPPPNDNITIEWSPSSTKIKKIIEHFQHQHSLDPTAKCLIFSQWRFALDCICSSLQQIGIQYLRIDGTITSKKRRIDFQERFNSDPEISAMVCSLNCSSEGINLQGANFVYIVDPWWTDSREEQAGNRAHRIGQTRPVTIYHVIANDTIEERVISLQRKKRALMDVTNGVCDVLSWDAEVNHLLGNVDDDD